MKKSVPVRVEVEFHGDASKREGTVDHRESVDKDWRVAGISPVSMGFPSWLYPERMRDVTGDPSYKSEALVRWRGSVKAARLGLLLLRHKKQARELQDAFREARASAKGSGVQEEDEEDLL